MSDKLALDEIAPKVFRKTNKHEGFQEFFSPESGEMRYLSYGRIIFTAQHSEHTLKAGSREYVIFSIKPGAEVMVAGKSFQLGEYDSLYVPRNHDAVIRGGDGCDVAIAGSTSEKDGEPALVVFNDVKDDPAYFFEVGTAELGTKRKIHNLIGNNVDGSRILAGFTIGEPSQWTSWPPHEHAASKEEFYLFFNMPKPAFSVQFVYSNVEDMEFAEAVTDGDCVTIPGGYHPTAAAPGYSSVFLWVMAGYNPAKDRDFKHGINIQADYQGVKFL